MNYFDWETHNNRNISSHLVSNPDIDWVSKTASFEINTFGYPFLHQLRPFYEPAVIEEYDWPIQHAIKAFIFSDDGEYSKYLGIPKNYPLVSLKGSLNKITASHPTFGVFKWNTLSKPNGREYFDFKLKLYSKKDGVFIASIDTLNILLSDEKVHQIERKRNNELSQLPESDASEFENAMPHQVGYESTKFVLLGGLQCKGPLLQCNGLCTLENAFVNHPWFAGSGDHVSSTHVMDILFQFSHLVIRSSTKHQRHFLFERIFHDLEFFDPQCKVTIYDWNIKFLKFLELNRVFEVVLESIKPLRDNKYRFPFAFQMDISIKQDNVKRLSASICVCPVVDKSWDSVELCANDVATSLSMV